jgi:hypothetical protein
MSEPYCYLCNGLNVLPSWVESVDEDEAFGMNPELTNMCIEEGKLSIRIYDLAYGREYIAHFPVRFCPNCGKEIHD